MNQQPASLRADWTGPKGTLNGEFRNPESITQGTLTFAELVGIVRRSSTILLFWLTLCLTIAGGFLYRTPAEYSASTLVILEPRQQVINRDDPAAASRSAVLDSAQVESQLQVVKSERILGFVFDQIGLSSAPELMKRASGWRERLLSFVQVYIPGGMHDRPPDSSSERVRAFQAFSDHVTTRRVGQSYVIEISYRALRPDQAARVANSITAAYIRDQIDVRDALARRGAEYLQDRVAAIKAEQDAALAAIRSGTIPDLQFPDSDARVISGALEPLGKSYPQTLSIVAFATVLGLLIGLAVIAVRHGTDERIRTRRQIMRLFGIECLAVVPRANLERRNSSYGQGVVCDAILADGYSPFAEAIRNLRTVLTAGSGCKHVSIGLVSWNRGAGTSTIASNLAHLIGASGDSVTLIDADLRAPSLTRTLTPKVANGLSDVLLGNVPSSDLLAAKLYDTLDFIPAVASGRASDPNIYLGSSEIRLLLNRLHAKRDVIVDLPALGSSSGAQALGPLLDGVVLIIEANRTTIEEITRAIRCLSRANTHIIGVLFNKDRTRQPSN